MTVRHYQEMTNGGLKHLSLVDWLDLTAKEMEIIRELVKEVAKAQAIPGFVLRLLDFSLTDTEENLAK